MKFKMAVVVALLASVYGCGTARPNATIEAPKIDPLSTQALNTNFVGQGIKIEWDCKYFSGITEATCIKGDIKSIEATGYAPSFGNSEAMRDNVFEVAEMRALDRLVRFVKQDVSSQRTVSTMAKNWEVAKDRIKQRIEGEVSMNDTDADKQSNVAVRENTNDAVRNVVSTIRNNAQGIIRGARPINQKIVDRQTVSVTIRWDRYSADAVINIQKKYFSQ